MCVGVGHVHKGIEDDLVPSPSDIAMNGRIAKAPVVVIGAGIARTLLNGTTPE